MYPLSIAAHYVLYTRSWLFPHLLIQNLWRLLLGCLLRSLLLCYLLLWSLLLSPLPPPPTLS